MQLHVAGPPRVLGYAVASILRGHMTVPVQVSALRTPLCQVLAILA